MPPLPPLPPPQGSVMGLKFAGRLEKSSLLSSSLSRTCLVSDLRGRGLGFLWRCELLPDLLLFLLTPFSACSATDNDGTGDDDGDDGVVAASKPAALAKRMWVLTYEV